MSTSKLKTSELPAPQGAPQPTPARAGLLRDYRSTPGLYDEMMTRGGEFRPHWKEFGRFLSEAGPADVVGRTESIQRLLRDHGVTYNVYDQAAANARPWVLDALPFIVSAEDARKVEEGLDQRGRLLNFILQDLYGSQRLLRDGLLPPRLVTANPGFLRPVAGVSPSGGKWIYNLGCDLVRDGAGMWRVLADRAQAPSGQGYALENRIIMAGVFAEEFEATQARRVAGYFEMKRDMLRSLAPKPRQGGAGILMLTPGPFNETYFEHAFQARYMGFPLIEGADLTTRDRSVYLKTLEGLRRVDVMVRHLDDVFCDPLELNSDSVLGAAGLVEAWRSGSIALANGLGTGLVETPALHPFMPGLCRHILGEEMKLPCVPTWWCGQRRELELVLANPDRWVLKPAFVRGARDPVFVADLDAEAKVRLLAAVKQAPHEWVAQEVLSLSTAPTWTGERIEARPLVWRAFATLNGESFAMMPGGLVRVSPAPHRWLVTMRSGGISKDAWVVGDGSPDPYFERSRQQPVVIRPARPPSGVPSRVADHLFWLGRYAERLENTVRIVRAVMQRMTGEQSQSQRRELRACTGLMTLAGLLPRGATGLRDHMEMLLRSDKADNGLARLLGRLRYNAAAARDRLSDDTWRLFNRIERDARLPQGPFVVSSAQGVLDTLVLDLSAFSGMQQENMTRGHGWRFLEIGKRLERASLVLELVDAATKVAGEDDSILGPLLEICDSAMTYRRQHFARPTLAPALDLLLLNDINPRSVAHQFQVLSRQVSQLPHDPHEERQESERGQMDALQSALGGLNLAALAQAPGELATAIPAFSQHLVAELEALSDMITRHYFAHALTGEG